VQRTIKLKITITRKKTINISSSSRVDMTEQNEHSSTLVEVAIPDDLQVFLEHIHFLAEGLVRGAFELRDEGLVLDETVWSPGGLIFRKNMLGLASEDLAAFDFQYNTQFFPGDSMSLGATRWDFSLSREEIAQIAQGTVKELILYVCANPVCGYRSAHEPARCPRCNLEAGTKIEGPHAQAVRGICPYCNKLLRRLFAQQCRHCRMDWHDPEHPTKLGAKSS
jgi:hypothetical protein